MKAIIDRFEGDFAIVEMDDGTFEDILRTNLPEKAREGSALVLEDESWKLDSDAECERSERIANKMAALFK